MSLTDPCVCRHGSYSHTQTDIKPSACNAVIYNDRKVTAFVRPFFANDKVRPTKDDLVTLMIRKGERCPCKHYTGNTIAGRSANNDHSTIKHIVDMIIEAHGRDHDADE